MMPQADAKDGLQTEGCCFECDRFEFLPSELQRAHVPIRTVGEHDVTDHRGLVVEVGF